MDGSRRSRVPGIPKLGPRLLGSPPPTRSTPHPLPQFLSPSLTPGATGLSGAQSVPGALLSPPHPGHAPGTQLPRHSAPYQCALGKGLPGGGGWAGSVRRLGRNGGPGERLGAAGVLAARQRQGRRGGAGALEGSGHSRGARLLPAAPGCGGGRCAEAAERLQPPPPPRSPLPCAMVTHSKFPAAGMSRPLDASLRLKTFSSKSEYQLVVNAVRKLQESGFYWSTVTGGEANLLLSAEPRGPSSSATASGWPLHPQRQDGGPKEPCISGFCGLLVAAGGAGNRLRRSSRHLTAPPAAPSLPRAPANLTSPLLRCSNHRLTASGAQRATTLRRQIPSVLSRPSSSNVALSKHLWPEVKSNSTRLYEVMAL